MNSTIIGLVAAVAVLSGAMGMSVTGVFDEPKLMTSNAATGFLVGHVEIEARNIDGDIIAYRQSDNAVVDDGEQCILKMLFGSTGQTNAGRGEYLSSANCTGVLTGAWDVIGIGIGTTAVADTDVKLESELVSGVGLDRTTATTKEWSNGTGATPTKIVLKNTFTHSADATVAVTESGLFNSTLVAGSGMLAHQTFTAVSLTQNDSITVTWTFTVGD